jgi:GTP cyclohydrolase I
MNTNKLQSLKSAFSQVVSTYQNELNAECLKNTPLRAANALHFLTQGYHQTVEDTVKNAVYRTSSDDLVIVKDIEFYSLCEHHLLPMIGKCHIAYLPKGKILGISKIPRIVDLYARRLQLQERLTDQIAQAIHQSITPRGVMVIMEASHLCVLMRGVEKQNPLLKTITSIGEFEQTDKQMMLHRLL